MEHIILSAFADEYSKDFDTQLAMLKENGIGYIEPRFLYGKNISDLTPNEAEEVSKKLMASGIKVSAIGSPLGKINLADDFEAHLEKARRVFSIAAKLGAKNIRVFSFYLHENKCALECRAEVVEKMGRLLDLADRFEVTLCHENEAEIYGESPEACHDLLSAFGGRLRCVFDMGNFVLGGFHPYPHAYELLKDYIEYFHIKDALYQGAIVPPGKGEASIAKILDIHTTRTKKDVFITLEPHLETFDGLNQLVGRSFENPYKFETPEAAFLTAIQNLKEMIQ